MPERLGSRYVLEAPLGRGAMGQVFRARVEPLPAGGGADGVAAAPVSGVRFAVKLLRDDLATDPDVVHRFLQEGRLLKSVDHPHVVRVHDLVAEGDRLALVMDLVDGGDLRRAVAVPCPEPVAAQIVGGVATGLAAVHAAGIVHRDLKPENVLVERAADGTALARIGDFGISRLDSASSTRTHGMTGTVGYIAPEIARGGVATAASDVYALGVILYELCAGHGPFRAEHPLALVRAHADDPVPRPAGMSDGVWELAEVLLAKDPAVRPPAAQVADRLRRLALALDPAVAALPPGAFPLPSQPAGGGVAAGGVEVGPAAATTIRVGAPGADGEAAGPGPVLAVPVPAGAAPMVGQPMVGQPMAGHPMAGHPMAGQPAPVLLPAPVPLPAPARPAIRGRRPRRGWYALGAVAALAAVAGGAWLAAGTPSLSTHPAVALGAPAGAGSAGATSTSSAGTDHSSGRTTAAGGDAASMAYAAPGATSGSPLVDATAAPGPRGTAAPTATVTAPTARAATAPVAPVTTAPVTAGRKTTGPTATGATAKGATAPAPASTAASSAPSTAPSSRAAAVTTSSTSSDPLQGTVPLYRYYNSSTGDHFYTTSYSELGGGGKGYVLERVQLHVYPAPVSGTVPLYRYYNTSTGDHFYTTNYSELGGGTGSYRSEGVTAYLYPSPVTGTLPLYRYYNPTTGDHFYTTDYGELGGGRGGYRAEGVAGYGR